jgi:hypothetical protein
MKHDKNVFRRLRAPAAATAPETQKVATGMRRHTTSLRAIHARGVHARHTFSKKKKSRDEYNLLLHLYKGRAVGLPPDDAASAVER